MILDSSFLVDLETGDADAVEMAKELDDADYWGRIPRDIDLATY